MNPYRVIDLENWQRRDVFHFFQTFSSPCINVTVLVEAQKAYDYAKAQGESFFLLSLYAILRAANEVPQFRQRQLEDGRVVEFETIAALSPIMTAAGLYNQARLEYAPTFDDFKKAALPIVEAARRNEDFSNMFSDIRNEDFICASCLPRLHFTSITQAELFPEQGAPLLAWGKLKNGLVPIGIKVNHAFVDGLHLSQFFECIEASLAQPKML